MIVTVEVASALGRPPAEDRWSRIVVDAGSEIEGELIACQMAYCRPDVVMPVRSVIVEVEL